jgi:hypothetical protein
VGYLGGLNIETKSFQPASEPNYFLITYIGEASTITINAAQIPEFSPILTVPMFMTATLD